MAAEKSTNWALPIAVAAAAYGVQQLVAKEILTIGGEPASTKPFSSFDEFYPFYLQEHSDVNTKRMHFVGTLGLIGMLAATPSLILALAPAAVVGLAVFPLTRHIRHGLIEMAAMIGTYLLLGKSLTGSWRRTLAVPLFAYAFAWVGHFYFEGNRPATFIYPLFSLAGDIRMFFQLATGQLQLW